MVTPLYLLFNGENVPWSFDRQEMEKLLYKEAGKPSSGIRIPRDEYLIPEVVETIIEADLAEKLKLLSPRLPVVNRSVSRSSIPEKYFQDRRAFHQEAREKGWEWVVDFRVFIIFESDGKCVWSPSGNNLNGFYERDPDRFIGEAVRVDLSEPQDVMLDDYFEWRADSF